MKDIELLEWALLIIVVLIGVSAYLLVYRGHLELGVGFLSMAAAYLAISISMRHYNKAMDQSNRQALIISRWIDNYFAEINTKIDDLDKKN